MTDPSIQLPDIQEVGSIPGIRDQLLAFDIGPDILNPDQEYSNPQVPFGVGALNWVMGRIASEAIKSNSFDPTKNILKNPRTPNYQLWLANPPSSKKSPNPYMAIVEPLGSGNIEVTGVQGFNPVWRGPISVNALRIINSTIYRTQLEVPEGAQAIRVARSKLFAVRSCLSVALSICTPQTSFNRFFIEPLGL